MRNTLLIIHVIAGGAWIGASLTITFANSRMRSSGHEAAASFMAMFEKMGRMYFPPAAIVLLVTGFWLVIDSSFYEFSDPFVIIGIAAVVAGALLGTLVFGPLAQRAQAAHRASDDAALGGLYRRFNGFGLLDVAILAFAIVAMVTKLGT